MLACLVQIRISTYPRCYILYSAKRLLLLQLDLHFSKEKYNQNKILKMGVLTPKSCMNDQTCHPFFRSHFVCHHTK